MDVQRISRGCNSTASSHTLLTNQQGLYAFQVDFPTGMNGRPSSTGQNPSAVVKERSCSQSPHLLWTLPQKRSNQSLTSERFGDLEAHPRASSGISSAKRLKGPTTAPLPDPPSSYDIANTTRLSRPFLDSFDSETVSPERAAPAEFPGDQLNPDRPKALRSPFEYTQRLVTSHIDPNAKKDIKHLDANETVPSEKSSRYIYYAPTNCYNKPDQGVHFKVPSRQLSYGDPSREIAPRYLHKTKGSWELRHEAERHAEDYNLELCSDNTLDTSATRPYPSEGKWSKPRLWLDLSEQEDMIQEAHAVTIRTSPSKPQVVSTSSHRPAINLCETMMTVCPDRGHSIPYPDTPPPTPASSQSMVGLGIESAAADWKYDEAYKRIKARPTWTQTSPSSNPSLTGTARRVAPERTPPLRAGTPKPTASTQPQLSELTSWIITELEASVASEPHVNLQLDSPVILQLCLPAGQRRVPKKTISTLPLSRYSNFNGPLSSHPTHPSGKLPPHVNTLQASSIPFTTLIMRSLHDIFPHAASQVLSSLQAIYLALHYVTAIRQPSPSSSSSPSSHSMPYIPSKARAMLGLQTPTTRPGLPASWTRPETQGWRARLEDLECKLSNEAVRVVRVCQGSHLDKDESLVKAIGQVITLGQEDAHRSSQPTRFGDP